MLNTWYLIFNIAVLLSAALLAVRFNFGKLKIRQLTTAYAVVSVPFVLWDMWALTRGHWFFNTTYTLDVYLFNIALEEVLFFITVPLVCLVIYLLIAQNIPGKISHKIINPIIGTIGLGGGALITLGPALSYTQVIGGVGLVFCLAVLFTRPAILYTKAFWTYQLILLALFIAANTFLTALPIIQYGSDAIIGFRVSTIPIEDFLYNFVLNSGFVLAYTVRR